VPHIRISLFLKEHVLLGYHSVFEESKGIVDFSQTVHIGILREWFVAAFIVFNRKEIRLVRATHIVVTVL
jgi:hypothetical protein